MTDIDTLIIEDWRRRCTRYEGRIGGLTASRNRLEREKDQLKRKVRRLRRAIRQGKDREATYLAEVDGLHPIAARVREMERQHAAVAAQEQQRNRTINEQARLIRELRARLKELGQ